MKKFIFYFLQFTYGILQNLVGLVLFVFNLGSRTEFFHGALIVYWKHRGCVSLGMFIFISESLIGDEELPFVKRHEYGHSIQSIILGPLYLPVIGLPSIIWAKSKKLQRRRAFRQIDYYSFYTEKWANRIFKHYIKD